MSRKSKVLPRQGGLRIALYTRVSTQHQAVDGDSLEAQKNEIIRFIELKSRLQGWTIEHIEHYEDAGRSAKDQNRPQLQRLKRDVTERKIDKVICFKLDRITRNLTDFAELWELFKECGVSVFSVREDFDTATPLGDALLKLIIIFAEMERKMTGERTKAVMLDRVSRGLWNGGWTIGYRSDPSESGKLIADPETAPLVKKIFDLLEELGSAGAVVKQLQKEGVTVPTSQSKLGRAKGGEPFKRQQVLSIVRNRLFIGRVQWGETFKDECHEAIIPKAQFERAQKLLEANKQGRTNTRKSRDYGYPLRGLVRCRCGAMMTPKGAFARGRQYHYYSCTTKAHRTSEGCGAKDVPAEALERAVVRRLSEIASTDAERERIREAAVKIVAADALRIDTEKVTTQHRLSEVTTQIGRLLSFLRDPDFAALDSVKLDLQKLEVEQKQLRERIADLDAQGGPLNEVISAANAFLRNWSGLDAILSEATPEELRNVLQHFVEVVEIRPNDEVGKMGQYTLGFLPGPDVVEPQEKPGNSSPALTDSPLFREVVSQAPRLGFEPRT